MTANVMTLRTPSSKPFPDVAQSVPRFEWVAGVQAHGGASSYTDLLAEAPDMSAAAASGNSNGGANSFGGPQGGSLEVSLGPAAGPA